MYREMKTPRSHLYEKEPRTERPYHQSCLIVATRRHRSIDPSPVQGPDGAVKVVGKTHVGRGLVLRLGVFAKFLAGYHDRDRGLGDEVIGE